MDGTGWHGKVTLVSPDGTQRIEVRIPGRQRQRGGYYYNSSPVPGSPHLAWRWNSRCAGKEAQLEKRFRRLLSRGWRVDTSTPETTGGGKGQGKNAGLGESQAQGRKRKGGNTSSVCRTTPKATREELQSAKKSVELLRELAGRSAREVTFQGTTVDVEGLLVALEVGDNPLPFLEVPRERPQIRVLITSDISGSTQGWSGLSQAWAQHLTKLEGADIWHLLNYNGKFLFEDMYLGEIENMPFDEMLSFLPRFDLVVYLGDTDGFELCKAYAQQGATVVGLDCYCANEANPRLALDKQHPRLYWVDRVSAKEPNTWYQALKLVLKKLT